MRYISILIFAFIISGCWNNTASELPSLENKATLPLMFTAPNILEKVSDDDHVLIVKSIKYALDGVKDGDVVEWVGETERINGRITLMNTSEVGGNKCRTFFNQLEIDGSPYSGNGKVCEIGKSWKVVKFK